MMQIDILTLFPAMFEGPMTQSMLWKARDRGLLDLRLHDIRDYATDRHRTVDDTPYGGGGGMILRADIVGRAIEAVVSGSAEVPVILMSPQGRLFSHAVAVELAQHDRLVLVCGHYEGIDDRVRQVHCTDEISIGDYVLTGGELAAMVIVDAVVRHIPGVLGAEGAAERDSHAEGILEGPQYTRPAVYRGLGVPPVLQDGNHGEIQAWRHREGLKRTWENRPDLLMQAQLSEADRLLLGQFADEMARKRRT
jgi:tRNA (guanine37-N1)-methyltransferase